jgi:hypothetical protein
MHSIAAIRSKSARAVTSRSDTTLRHPRLGRDIGHARDHDRLRRLAHKARCEQALGQVGRQVVTVVLPLEPLAALGKEAHLTRDQLVEGRAHESSQVAIEHPAATGPAREAQQRPLRLDDLPRRQRVGHPRTKLSVVGRQQLGRARVKRLTLCIHSS